MNFAQMLMTPVAPVQPTRGRGNTDTTNAVARRMANAQAKYKAAIGHEWASSALVSSRLGFTRMTAYKTLVKYEGMGLLERRPLDGKPYNTRRGFEWRWK